MGRLAEKFILRRASIYANPGNPPDRLPRVRGDLTTGELGVVPAIEIQKWNGTNQVFLISDDVIDTTSPTVYVDNVATGAGWTFNASNNFESRGNVATLTFTVDQTGKQISVKCKGKKNAAGTLIENLAEIVKDLLVDVHELDAGEWNSVAYSQAFNDCATLGYVGGGVILDDIDPVSLADSILKPGGGAYVSAGKLKLFIETLPASPTPEDTFDDHELDTFSYTLSVDGIVNDLSLEYRFNWRKRHFSSLEKHFDAVVTKSDTQSQVDFKIRSQTPPQEAPWLRTAAAAGAMGDKLIALKKRPRAAIRLGLKNARAILAQPADIVAFSCTKFPGGSAVGQPGYKRLIRLHQVDTDFMGGIVLHGIDLQVNVA